MVEKRGDVTEVGFMDAKILDEASIDDIGRQLFELVKQHPSIKLLLDFSTVQYLSSAALGMLITLNKRVAETKGKLVLCSIRPQIYEVFKITKLNLVFDIVGDERAALAHF